MTETLEGRLTDPTEGIVVPTRRAVDVWSVTIPYNTKKGGDECQWKNYERDFNVGSLIEEAEVRGNLNRARGLAKYLGMTGWFMLDVAGKSETDNDIAQEHLAQMSKRIRDYLVSEGNAPLNILAGDLNSQTYDGERSQSKFTCFSAGQIVVDESGARVTTVLGGLPRPRIYRAENQDFDDAFHQECEAKAGFPLGIVPEYAYETLETTLGPRDVYIMTSDGFNEFGRLHGMKEEHLWETVRKVLRTHPEGKAHELGEKIIYELGVFHDVGAWRNVHDDITLGIVRTYEETTLNAS
jgi:hypothetical protein